jgi:3-phosphoshikimate 1-carboxyvinyltransferase
MQSLSVPSGRIVPSVSVPPSKSYANRALILAALAGSRVRLENLPAATDVTNLVDALRALGLDPERTETSLRFRSSFPACEGSGELEILVGEGGTTARFLAVLLLLGSRPYKLILGERLKERPWGEFLDLAGRLGARVSLRGRELWVQGPVVLPRELAVDCSETTQFATAFQLLGLRTGVTVAPENLTASQSYWTMTQELVRAFAAGPATYTIPRDWSSASYPLAFAALNHPVEFPGLRNDRLQADAKFLPLLESFGCVRDTGDGITVVPLREHRSVEFDVSDCLDLVPALGYFLAHVEGNHVLTGVENLVHKESDRLMEVMALVRSFERSADTGGGTLTIRGSADRRSRPVDLRLPDDHRMVMAGALFLRHHAGGAVSPTEAVAKSYPGFFELFAG